MQSWLKFRVLGTAILGCCVVLGGLVPCGFSGQQRPGAPLTRAEVVELLDAGVPPKRVAILAEERGVTFEITSEVEQVLRRAGATASLIETLRGLSGKSSGPPVLAIESRPGGAQVFVDDELVARTSTDGRLRIAMLSPGKHRLRVSAEGYADFEQEVELVGGRTVTVTAVLDSPRSNPAVLQVESRPGGAAVYVDGEFLARTSSEGRLKVSTLPPGAHQIRVTAQNYSDFERSIDLVPGKVLTVVASLSPPGAKAGAAKVNPRDGQKYVWLPPGSFTMGCSHGDTSCFDNENPPHQVTLTRGFWMGQTEVTVAAYKRFASETGRRMPGEPVIVGRNHNSGWKLESHPMVAVSWDEAVAYCTWAGARLPTEAEWEYAARAGTTTARYGVMDDIAWYGNNSGRAPIDSDRIIDTDSAKYDERLAENGNTNRAVGLKRPNAFGLFDMLGGVWEWVNDWYGANYFSSTPEYDPKGPATGETRVERGGSWQSISVAVRASRRATLDPKMRWTDVGMRCAWDAAP